MPENMAAGAYFGGKTRIKRKTKAEKKNALLKGLRMQEGEERS